MLKRQWSQRLRRYVAWRAIAKMTIDRLTCKAFHSSVPYWQWPPSTYNSSLSLSQTETFLTISKLLTIQCESTPPGDLWQFFQNDWEFFNQILPAYYAFLSMLDYEFLFNYLQL